jgi:Protein of unknown function (DUF3306)
MIDSKPPKRWSLERWSRMKHETAREKDNPPGPAPAPAASSAAPAVPSPAAAANAAAGAVPASTQGEPLPPIESLTIDSDFSAFLKPMVDETLKRKALKQLFRDPRFNVMDGLDTYIADYSQPDPIDSETVRQMVQGRYIFDPPQTRVNAQGFVEDVPADEVAFAPAEAVEASSDPADPHAEVAAASAQPLADAAAAVPAAVVPGESAVEARASPRATDRSEPQAR